MDYPHWYRGNKRDPDAIFRHHWVEAFIGKEVTILGTDDYEQGRVRIEIDGVYFDHVPLWLFEKSINITTLTKPKRKAFPWAKESVRYYAGFQFRFPCSFEQLSIKEARELAEWILKVTK